MSAYEHDLLHFDSLDSPSAYRAEMDRLSADGWEPIGPPQVIPRVGMVEIYQAVRRRLTRAPRGVEQDALFYSGREPRVFPRSPGVAEIAAELRKKRDAEGEP